MTAIPLVAHTSAPELGSKADMMDGGDAESQTPAVLPRKKKKKKKRAGRGAKQIH